MRRLGSLAAKPGYRNPERFKLAVFFHCGGFNLWPPRFTHGIV